MFIKCIVETNIKNYRSINIILTNNFIHIDIQIMNKAIIDLGTNTFNLLIAELEEDTIRILHSEKIGAAIGMGGINNNIITPEAINRSIEALSIFKEKCNQFNVYSIFAFGTSAIRDAKNNAEFIELVKSKLGINIQIIDGQKEAELIYNGVKHTVELTDYVIMDIGGGSTEFIFIKNEKVKEAHSFNIGISRIYQYFENISDPLTEQDVTKIEDWLNKTTQKYFSNKNEQVLIGASGTFETFYELIENKPFPQSSQSIKLDKNLMNSVLDELIYSSQEQRNANQFLIPIRKLMAPIAAVKTRWILNQLNIEEIWVSPYSLKEGALFSI